MLKKEIVKNRLIVSRNFLFPIEPDGNELAGKVPAFLFLHVFPGFYTVFVKVIVCFRAADSIKSMSLLERRPSKVGHHFW